MTLRVRNFFFRESDYAIYVKLILKVWIFQRALTTLPKVTQNWTNFGYSLGMEDLFETSSNCCGEGARSSWEARSSWCTRWFLWWLWGLGSGAVASAVASAAVSASSKAGPLISTTRLSWSDATTTTITSRQRPSADCCRYALSMIRAPSLASACALSRRSAVARRAPRAAPTCAIAPVPQQVTTNNHHSNSLTLLTLGRVTKTNRPILVVVTWFLSEINNQSWIIKITVFFISSSTFLRKWIFFELRSTFHNDQAYGSKFEVLTMQKSIKRFTIQWDFDKKNQFLL